MNTEILLSRGETVTSFEIPAAGRIRVCWPEPKTLKIVVPVGSSIEALKENFRENYKDILNSELLAHLETAWPTKPIPKADRNPVPLTPWEDVHIEIVPKKAPKSAAEIELDRPRITIQMGQRVDEFSENCKKHLNAELFEQIVRLWSDPDYCRTVLPVGRNLLIRGCA